MRWTALNWPSSLTNTSDLSTLLRSLTLTNRMLGGTYLLSANTIEKKNHSQNNEHPIKKEKEKEKKKQKRKKGRGGITKLSLTMRELNLRHPT